MDLLSKNNLVCCVRDNKDLSLYLSETHYGRIGIRAVMKNVLGLYNHNYSRQIRKAIKYLVINPKNYTIVKKGHNKDYYFTRSEVVNVLSYIVNSFLVCGKGINDYVLNAPNCTKSLAYICWSSMINRCYNSKYHKNYPTYKECFVCDDWLYYSVFKKWFEQNHVDHYVLDKDVLVKGNKCYSPETCVFIPPLINTILLNRVRCRGLYFIGVCKDKRYRPQPYYSKVNDGFGNSISLGSFSTENEAYNAYKKKKESIIKDVALRHFKQGLISSLVFNALINYKVEKSD